MQKAAVLVLNLTQGWGRRCWGAQLLSVVFWQPLTAGVFQPSIPPSTPTPTLLPRLEVSLPFGRHGRGEVERGPGHYSACWPGTRSRYDPRTKAALLKHPRGVIRSSALEDEGSWGHSRGQPHHFSLPLLLKRGFLPCSSHKSTLSQCLTQGKSDFSA